MSWGGRVVVWCRGLHSQGVPTGSADHRPASHRTGTRRLRDSPLTRLHRCGGGCTAGWRSWWAGRSQPWWLAIASVTSANDVNRIKSALRLQTNCQQIVVRRPSHATLVKRWAGSTVQSADVICVSTGPDVTYARFLDRGRLDSAVAASLPSGGYCRLGNAVMVARLVGAASTVLSDMCQSLGGTLIIASSNIAWMA